MNKESLLKKARERGITLDETQAEKYVNLSDEELENLAVSGGCGDPPADTRIWGDDLYPSTMIVINDPNRAASCCEFAQPRTGTIVRSCEDCSSRAQALHNGQMRDACYDPRLVSKIRFSRGI
ncbi:MAG: hypothetical protein LBM59_03615 [Ruminococcus sp.]|jgi:hypothetical protein|nr:hypothetical protein [Ruminococcus sp.]